MTTRRLLVLGALALAGGAGARLWIVPAAPAVATFGPPAAVPEKIVSPSPPLPALPPGRSDGSAGDSGPARRSGWSVVWTRPAPSLLAMDLSADGRFIAWVDDRGSIRLMDAASGRTLWRAAPSAGINAVVAVPGAPTSKNAAAWAGAPAVLAYSRLNPAAPTVHVLPRGGRGVSAANPAVRTGSPPATVPVDGAVWDVAVSPRGNAALIGTGRRSAYVLPLRRSAGPKDPEALSAASAMRRWQTPGIPQSILLGDREPIALLATWQQSGVWAYGLDGTPREIGLDESDSARLYQIVLSANNKTVVGVSARAPRESNVRLHVWDASTGASLFVTDLPAGAHHPRVRVSSDGNCIAVTYLKMTHYRTGEVAEHKLAAWDRNGRALFREKGGSGFFSPDEIVAVSPGGDRLTVQDKRRNLLYTLDGRGRFVHQMRLPGASATPPVIRETVATPDGAFLLVHRGDGQISLLRAAAPAGKDVEIAAASGVRGE